MDLRRIERALREGPPDEPAYVPGSFRRSAPRGASLTLVGTAVMLALVAGIAIGTGLAALRGENVGGPRVLTAADLLGTWSTGEITRQAWIDGASAAGFDAAAIDDFLAHDPIQDRVRYTLEFFTGETFTDRVMVKAEYDGRPIADLGGGAFAVLADGTLRFTEIVPGTPEPRCEVALAVDLQGDRMALEIQAMQDCDPDAQLAYTVFFELGTYTRQLP